MVLDKEMIKYDSFVKYLNHYSYSRGSPSWHPFLEKYEHLKIT